MSLIDLKVLIVADSLLARAGLAAMLEEQPDTEVVGQTRSGPRLAADIELYQPDLILVDLDANAAEMLRALVDIADLGLPLVALAPDSIDVGSSLSLLSAFDSYGLLLRERSLTDLPLLMQSVAQGYVVLDPGLAADWAEAGSLMAPNPIPETLTARENEVLQLLAQGLTNKGIAQTLGITDHTVKFHVNAIMSKLNAQSRTDAVVRASRAGLILF